jgi:hypothetical protein
MSLTALWLLVSDTLESLKLYLHEQQAQQKTPLKHIQKTNNPAPTPIASLKPL